MHCTIFVNFENTSKKRFSFMLNSQNPILDYDIIIAGGGLAGLSLVCALIKQGVNKEKKILVIDAQIKNTNDRTWSFWAKNDFEYAFLSSKTWEKAKIIGQNGQTVNLNLFPYKYHTIRGIDFYNYANSLIDNSPNVDLITERIENVSPLGFVKTVTERTYTGELIFSSIYDVNTFKVDKNNVYLLQHFKGQIIETKTDSFEDEAAVLMDFRVKQDKDTRFGYVLPIDKRKALVEFTLFSNELLDENQYNNLLEDYIKSTLSIDEYAVVEEEFGVIPMTDYDFSPYKNGKVYNIGTIGGFVKPSSGYCLTRTIERTNSLASQLSTQGKISYSPNSKWVFRFFDDILLKLLNKNKIESHKFFTQLYAKRGIEVFNFLDEKTSTLGNLKILMSSSQKIEFIKQAIKYFLKK